MLPSVFTFASLRLAQCLLHALVAGVLALGAVSAQAQAPNSCGGLGNHYGPWDYRTQKEQLHIVEKFHFTPRVEALMGGESSAFFGDDLSYTLATSPNHHRALVALVRYTEKTKNPRPPNMTWSTDCYFDRAVRFANDDVIVRILYANYLGKTSRKEEAAMQLEIAGRLAGDFGFTHYNVGLAYFALGLFDKAQEHAQRAREFGFPRDDLEEMLKKGGHWKQQSAEKP